MELQVMYQGKNVGTCQAEDLGLYWRLKCHCVLLSDRVERLYWGSMRLGVLDREGDALTLDRRLSKQSLPGFPAEGGFLTLEPDLEAWQGTVLDCVLPRGFQKKEQGETQLLFPFSPDRPFPCMPLFCFFCLDGPYWRLTLDKDGLPMTSVSCGESRLSQ